MDQAVNDASQGEDASNDGQHVDQELEEVFFRVSVLHRKGRHLVVENDNAFEGGVFDFARCRQLEHFPRRNEFLQEQVREEASELA